jgi:ABC-type uncharacterized transport system ATPase subunit
MRSGVVKRRFSTKKLSLSSKRDEPMKIANDIIVNMRNISKIFPGFNAFENMDSFLKRGEIQPLLGENGVGFIQTKAGDL